MKACIVCIVGIVAIASTWNAFGSKDAGNRPYVQSGPDGVLYARCIPQATTGSAGSTDIYKVQKDRDELVDHYDWFTRRVVLGWSPIAGKVAIMAVHRDAPTSLDQQVELSFYLGGKALRTWSTADLKVVGAEISPSRSGGERAKFRVGGCEQIPGTNEYVFTIELAGEKKLSFDILTGELYQRPTMRSSELPPAGAAGSRSP